jgi:hypothetical protein
LVFVGVPFSFLQFFSEKNTDPARHVARDVLGPENSLKIKLRGDGS